MNERHTTFPSAPEAFFLVVCLWALQFLLSCALYDVRGGLGLEDPYSLGTIAMVLANGVIFTGLLHWKNLSYRDLFQSSRSATAATLVIVVPLVVLATPLLILVMGSLDELVQAAYPMSSGMKEQFSQMHANVAQLAMTCVLAPVLEEMLFRGVILRSFLQQYERGYAILGSSVIFGFAHGNIYQLVYATLFGLAAGWLYERTRSLIPGIALHMSANSGGLLWLAIAGPDAVMPGTGTWAFLAVPALAACYALRRLLAETAP